MVLPPILPAAVLLACEKLGDQDSNLDKQNQNLSCYRYTIAQRGVDRGWCGEQSALMRARIPSAWTSRRGGEFVGPTDQPPSGRHQTQSVGGGPAKSHIRRPRHAPGGVGHGRKSLTQPGLELGCSVAAETTCFGGIEAEHPWPYRGIGFCSPVSLVGAGSGEADGRVEERGRQTGGSDGRVRRATK